MLQVGTKAPEFTLPDKDGNLVSLKDFQGKKVVLYFYPIFKYINIISTTISRYFSNFIF